MKVNCDVCEKAQATLLCCADDAALCGSCDSRVHDANKLASKHHRVPLLYPSPDDELPLCDICQEKTGYFFCLEDRALLCRNCDFSIHSANSLTAKHKRYLVTGIQVALQVIKESIDVAQSDSPPKINSPTDCQLSSPRASTPKQNSSTMLPAQMSVPSTSISEPLSPVYENSDKNEGIDFQEQVSTQLPVHQKSQNESIMSYFPAPTKMAKAVPEDNQQMCFNSGRPLVDWALYAGMNDVSTDNDGSCHAGAGGFAGRNSSSEYWTDTIPGWKVDELLNLPDMPPFHATADCGSSKAEASSSGDMDWHIECNAFEDFNEGDVGSDFPSVPSPPTASGILRLGRAGGIRKSVKQLDSSCSVSGNTLLVPDISPELSLESPNQKRIRML